MFEVRCKCKERALPDRIGLGWMALDMVAKGVCVNACGCSLTLFLLFSLTLLSVRDPSLFSVVHTPLSAQFV